jgi:hypothetical protein
MAVQSCATRKWYFDSGLIIAVRRFVVRFRRGPLDTIADNFPNLSASIL